MKTAPAEEKVTQSFEWIPHGDASARKRARAHVTRGFRREKAAQAKKEKNEKERRDSSSQSSSSPPQDDVFENPGSSRTTSINPPDATLFQPYEQTVEGAGGDPVGATDQGLVLQHALGSERTDPFLILPVQLGPGTHALLDHCKSGPVVTLVLVINKHEWLSPLRCCTGELQARQSRGLPASKRA